MKRVRVTGLARSTGAFAPRVQVQVQVPNWGGPVSRFGMFDRLTVGLNGTGISPDQVMRAVRALSHEPRTAVRA